MPFLPRLSSPALAAVGLVLAGIALTPGTAAASCGSYVTIMGHADASGPSPVAPVVPCHGPGCSKAPAAPAVPLTAPISSARGAEHPTAHADSTADPTSHPGWAQFQLAQPHPVRLA